MRTADLIALGDNMLNLPTHRQHVTDLGNIEQQIIDHCRHLADQIDTLLAKNRCGDAAIQACNIADLLRMQSRLARRISDLRAAAA